VFVLSRPDVFNDKSFFTLLFVKMGKKRKNRINLISAGFHFSVPFLHAEHPERCETRSLSADSLLVDQQVTDY